MIFRRDDGARLLRGAENRLAVERIDGVAIEHACVDSPGRQVVGRVRRACGSYARSGTALPHRAAPCARFKKSGELTVRATITYRITLEVGPSKAAGPLTARSLACAISSLEKGVNFSRIRALPSH
jgi:hypothetical protein